MDWYVKSGLTRIPGLLVNAFCINKAAVCFSASGKCTGGIFTIRLCKVAFLWTQVSILIILISTLEPVDCLLLPAVGFIEACIFPWFTPEDVLSINRVNMQWARCVRTKKRITAGRNKRKVLVVFVSNERKYRSPFFVQQRVHAWWARALNSNVRARVGYGWPVSWSLQSPRGPATPPPPTWAQFIQICILLRRRSCFFRNNDFFRHPHQMHHRNITRVRDFYPRMESALRLG